MSKTEGNVAFTVGHFWVSISTIAQPPETRVFAQEGGIFTQEAELCIDQWDGHYGVSFAVSDEGVRQALKWCDHHNALLDLVGHDLDSHPDLLGKI